MHQLSILSPISKEALKMDDVIGFYGEKKKKTHLGHIDQKNIEF
jgi:hypothetical protein